MVGVEEGREFRFRGDLYSQESTFPLVKTAISIMVISNRNTTADLKCPAASRSNCTTPRSLVHWSASAPAAIDRYLLYTPPALSSKPTGRRCCCRLIGQTDGRTDRRTDGRTDGLPTAAYMPRFAYYVCRACFLHSATLFFKRPK